MSTVARSAVPSRADIRVPRWKLEVRSSAIPRPTSNFKPRTSNSPMGRYRIMRISRRRFGALTLAGGTTLLLAACSQTGGGNRTGGGTGGGGSVTFVTGLAEEERQVVGDLLNQFQSQAGMQVKMVQM